MSQKRRPEAVHRIPDIADALGVTRTTIWRWQKSGNFPASVKLSPGGVVGIREDDYQAWLDSRKKVGRAANAAR